MAVLACMLCILDHADSESDRLHSLLVIGLNHRTKTLMYITHIATVSCWVPKLSIHGQLLKENVLPNLGASALGQGIGTSFQNQDCVSA